MIGIGEKEALQFHNTDGMCNSSIIKIKGLPTYYAVTANGRLHTYWTFIIIYLN